MVVLSKDAQQALVLVRSNWLAGNDNGCLHDILAHLKRQPPLKKISFLVFDKSVSAQLPNAAALMAPDRPTCAVIYFGKPSD